MSCKDKNRNQIESSLFAWDRAGLRNLLVLAGDYPQSGYRGYPKPVFDLDTVHLLDLIGRLNREQPGGDRRHPAAKGQEPTSFCRGCVVSPFKHLESEQMMQYFKLQRKVAAGAEYVITQVGYDARKFQELLLFMRRHGLHLPVLGNVFVPSPKVARLMNLGQIPGVELPGAYYQKLQEDFQAGSAGRKRILARAARLICVLKGLGYAGVHLGGPGLTFADFDYILAEQEARQDDWPEFIAEFSAWPRDSFFYFQEDPGSGLNLEVPSSLAPARNSMHYGLSRRFHGLFFAEEGLLCRPFARFCQRLDRGGHGGWFARFEHMVKFLLYHCRNCGDCTLAELAFLCPQSGCAKNILNGACGGSRLGWCEVYPERRRCLYVLIYERLKSSGLMQSMQEGLVPPRDWSLNETSSWINFFMHRDHHNRRK